jgi:hypothetical protein
LFQLYWDMNRDWMSALGYTANDLYSPRINAKLAYALYQRVGSWKPWSQTNY